MTAAASGFCGTDRPRLGTDVSRNVSTVAWQTAAVTVPTPDVDPADLETQAGLFRVFADAVKRLPLYHRLCQAAADDPHGRRPGVPGEARPAADQHPPRGRPRRPPRRGRRPAGPVVRLGHPRPPTGPRGRRRPVAALPSPGAGGRRRRRADRHPLDPDQRGRTVRGDDAGHRPDRRRGARRADRRAPPRRPRGGGRERRAQPAARPLRVRVRPGRHGRRPVGRHARLPGPRPRGAAAPRTPPTHRDPCRPRPPPGRRRRPGPGPLVGRLPVARPARPAAPGPRRGGARLAATRLGWSRATPPTTWRRSSRPSRPTPCP